MTTRFLLSPTLVLMAAISLPPAPAQAGQTKKDAAVPHPKIIGGENAGTNEFPYMSGILDSAEPDPFLAQFCGATAIHPYWVVTAAHCVEGLLPSDVDVLVGTSNLEIPGVSQRIRVADIVTYPFYNAAVSDGDIALLLLSEPITVIGTFARLATDPATFAPGTLATVLGWGATTAAEDFFPPELQKAVIPTVSRATAEPFYAAEGLPLTENMLFAGLAEGGKDTCGGDSGGPLLVPDGVGGFLFAGITSFGLGLPCGSPENYGAYTRIASYAAWVNSIVSPNRAAWEAAFASPANASDTDADRSSGFAEFASWTNPNSGASLPRLIPGTTSLAGVIYPTVTFRRLAPPSEVDYLLDYSSGLTGWMPQNTTAQLIGTPQTVPGLPQMQSVTFRGPTALSANPSGFFQLRVRPGGAFVPSIRELPFPGSVLGGLSNLDPVGTAPSTSYTKCFRLSQLTPGSAVALSLRSSDFDTGLSVVDEGSGAVVAEDFANAGGGTDDALTFVPQAGQTYLVKVASDDVFGTGDFTLTAFAPFANLPQLPVGATGGFLSEQDPPDPIWLPAETYYSDDYLLTNAPVGSHVVVTMVSGEFDCFLELVNAETGELIDSNDDSASAGGLDAYLNFVVSTTTPLLIRASSAVQLETGAYTLTRSAGATLAVPANVDGSLSVEDPIDPNFPDPYYRDDYYLSNLTDNQPATVTVGSPDIDLYLFLIDGVTGDILEEVDEQFVGTPETFSFTRLPGQFLILRVSSFDPQETGNYSITVSSP